MSSHRTLSPPEPSAWRVWVLRGFSLLVVAAIGVGVFVAWRQTETQACLNRSFARSLDDRGRATDDLISALFRLNARLQTADSPQVELEARRAFSEEVDRVARTRKAAQASTEADQEARCV